MDKAHSRFLFWEAAATDPDGPRHCSASRLIVLRPAS